MRIVAGVFAAWLGIAAPVSAAWQDLFTGRDLDGWDLQTKAIWKVVDGVITVCAGAKGLLTSRGTYQNFELELEFKAADDTHSGIMLCSPKEVTNPGSEAYEVAIAPQSSSYPTGSLAGRMRHDGREYSGWRKLKVKVDAGKVEVWLDGEKTVDYEDRRPLGWGHIGLEFDRGRAEFRNIRVQKLDLP